MKQCEKVVADKEYRKRDIKIEVERKRDLKKEGDINRDTISNTDKEEER